jgi:membrane-associated protease RseP (regulator of RpoE activity)
VSSEHLPPTPTTEYSPPPPEIATTWVVLPPRRKFQQRYGRHITLFLLTLFTASLVPAFDYLIAGIFGQAPGPLQFFRWDVFKDGLTFSIPLLAILGAHEFGHYFACKYYNVDASLPYFIPSPIGLAGTFGAVIRIREPFPSKRALFDVGVAGPIGGFVVLVPLLWIGITLSTQVPVAGLAGATHLGDPLLVRAFAYLHFGHIPDGYDVALHPMAFAAWWGMLATALNLLPFGQLDGGHIAYAALGRRAVWVSRVTLVVAVGLVFVSMSWLTMVILLLVMTMFLGFRHPPVPDEYAPLDRTRLAVALFALVMFVLCFTPVPIDVFGN